MMQSKPIEIQEITDISHGNHDIMLGVDRYQVNVLDHGFVALVDLMPRVLPFGHTCDNAIEQAARVSYQHETRKITETRGLIRYLMRHTHTTPYEMVELKFHCKMPVFIARQWVRHRTANVNEVSGRYSKLPGEFFIPKSEDLRAQSNKSKQVSEGQVDSLTAAAFVATLDAECKDAYRIYEEAIEKGIGREQARIGLPLNIYTEWYWKIDLHNLFHFLALRMHEHAQKEIQDYAFGMFEIIRKFAPLACEAFQDYHPMVGGMKLSRLEIEAIIKGKDTIDTDNKREQEEWQAKRRRLGFLKD